MVSLPLGKTKFQVLPLHCIQAGCSKLLAQIPNAKEKLKAKH
jgi:hypothetical protein